MSVKWTQGVGLDLRNHEHQRALIASLGNCCLCGGDPVALYIMENIPEDQRYLFAPGDVPPDQVRNVYTTLCVECAFMEEDILRTAVELQIKEDAARSRGEGAKSIGVPAMGDEEDYDYYESGHAKSDKEAEADGHQDGLQAMEEENAEDSTRRESETEQEGA